MYKTSIITDEISQDLGVAIDTACRFGLDAIEIRSVDEKTPFQMTRDDFVAIRRAADANGLLVSAVASPFFKCAMDDEAEIAAHLAGLRRCCEGAHILGARLIRGFTFWRAPDARISLEAVAERFGAVIRLLASEGITMAIESEPSVTTCCIERLEAFLRIVDSPLVRALYDPGNEVCEPGAPPPWPDGYARIRPLIAHVHIKDMRRTEDGFAPACIGEGDVNFDDIFAALARDGFDGYASLETHWRVQSALDEALLVRPQGSGFSQGGLQASEICLRILGERYGFGNGGTADA